MKKEILDAFCSSEEGRCNCSQYEKYCFRGKLSLLLDKLIDSAPEDAITLNPSDPFPKGWNGMCNNIHNWKKQMKEGGV